MPSIISSSALECLRILFSQVRREVNFNALLTDETVRNAETAEGELTVLLQLSEAQKLEPEQLKELINLPPQASGPALIRLGGRHWILLQNIRQLADENTVIVEPVPNHPPRALRVKSAEIRERFDGAAIFFRNLQEVDSAKQTALYCLCNIAKHHGVNMDIRRVMHDYAIGEEEPRDALLQQIASDYQFKCKFRKLDWEKLLQLGKAYPAIAVKKNGRKILLCGVRTVEDRQELAVIDPENKKPGTPFEFLNREQFEAEYSGRTILLKKTYRLADEEQPFSLRWFIPEFIKLRGIFGQIALTVALITLLSLIVPLFFQIVVDKVLVNKAYNTLNVLGIGIIAAVVFNGFLEFVRNYFLLFATNKIDISTATKTFRHLMRLPIDFFERVPSGVLLKHMQQTERIRGFLSGNLFFTILDVCALCIFIPFLLLYSIPLTLIVLGYSVLMALVIACLIKPFQTRLNELYQAEGKRQSMLVESIHGVRTVKSLALEPIEEQHWDDTTAYAIKSYFRVGKISITAKSISQVLEMMMTITVIWVGALLVFDQKLSIGALIAFQMLSGRVTGPLVKMVGLIHEYQQIALSVKMLGVVMNTPTEPAGGGVRNPLHGGISFENVTFSYDGADRPVLTNVSFHLPQGEAWALVGPSGGGKTTIARLIPRFFDVQAGAVLLGGRDVRSIPTAELMEQISFVFQEVRLFKKSIRDNIRAARPDATEEEILHAAQLAQCGDILEKTPGGLDAVIGAKGVYLSGGEMQRIALARAILKDAPIVVLDEASSFADPENEAKIQKAFEVLMKGKTVLMIAHRLSTVRNMDRILVVRDGEIAEEGKHDELLEKGGVYAAMWEEYQKAAQWKVGGAA